MTDVTTATATAAASSEREEREVREEREEREVRGACPMIGACAAHIAGGEEGVDAAGGGASASASAGGGGGEGKGKGTGATPDRLRAALGVAPGRITVFTKATCQYCTLLKRLLDDEVCVPYVTVDIGQQPPLRDALVALTGRATVPQLFVGLRHVGGYDDTRRAAQSLALSDVLSQEGVF